MIIHVYKGRMDLENSHTTHHFLRTQVRTKTKEGFKPREIMIRKQYLQLKKFFKISGSGFLASLNNQVRQQQK